MRWQKARNRKEEKMKKPLLFAFVMIFAACAQDNDLKALDGMPDNAPVKEIHLVGQNCVWTPNAIEVPAGTHVILELESLDISYKCDVEDYGLQFEVPAGKEIKAEFYASSPDRLEVGCKINRNAHYQWGGVHAELKIG
jgi:heme/copper-type cytochrome/quinol oxidase subunit 2